MSKKYKLEYAVQKPKKEREKIREGLLKYCELDTYAMAKIWVKFNEVIGEKNMGLFDIIFGTGNQGGGKFKTGDKVRVKYRGQEGYIISVDGSLYMVSMNDGELVDYYTEDQLEKCGI